MATERLPIRHIREILRLKWSLKRSHRETARSLRISPGAVASVMSRASAIGLTGEALEE
jgi:DNA-directed RNA polymerase specialized sigma24 family protein